MTLKRAVGILPPLPEPEAEPPYTVRSILADGCFLDLGELDALLSRLEAKKNLVLQGPPGTGKTWLAKRLAYALIGRQRSRTHLHRAVPSDTVLRGLRSRLATVRKRA